jgi:hypothetical protein
MKKFFTSMILTVALFLFAPIVFAQTIDSNEFLTLDKEASGDYTITLLKDVSSSDFNDFFMGHFSSMIDGNITIAGHDFKITNNGSSSSMIALGSSSFNTGVAATFNDTTKVWTTTDSGLYGYNHLLKFQNVSFVGTGDDTGSILVYIVLPNTDVNFDSCSFSGYKKAAIWTANFKNMTINNCTFNGDSVNPDANAPTLYGQSSESISFCLGDEFDTTSSTYSTHKVESITLTNNTFKNIKTSTPNGTSAIKLKIKNKTVVTGVNSIVIKNNTFDNNLVDVAIGEKNPETTKPSSVPTTADDSANLNVTFNNNTSSNSGGLKILTVHNYSLPEADRTIFISTSQSDTLYNATLKVEFKQDNNNGLTLSGDTKLDEALNYVKTDDRASNVNGLNITNSDSNIFIAKNDIKEDRTNTITDLGFNLIKTVDNKDLTKYEADNVLFLVTNVSGNLPASKITITTKVNFADGSIVNLKYYNETTKALEVIGSYTVKNGSITFDLTHYSSYILENTPAPTTSTTTAIANPKTADNIINYVMLSLFASLGLYVAYRVAKKQN